MCQIKPIKFVKLIYIFICTVLWTNSYSFDKDASCKVISNEVLKAHYFGRVGYDMERISSICRWKENHDERCTAENKIIYAQLWKDFVNNSEVKITKKRRDAVFGCIVNFKLATPYSNNKSVVNEFSPNIELWFNINGHLYNALWYEKNISMSLVKNDVGHDLVESPIDYISEMFHRYMLLTGYERKFFSSEEKYLRYLDYQAKIPSDEDLASSCRYFASMYYTEDEIDSDDSIEKRFRFCNKFKK